MGTDCLMIPLNKQQFTDSTGRIINEMRYARYNALIDNNYKQSQFFSARNALADIPNDVKCKLSNILNNFPGPESMRESVFSTSYTEPFNKLHTYVRLGNARVLLYGPPGCGKLTMVLTVCAVTRSFPYIVTLAELHDQNFRNVLGYALSIESRPPTVVVTDCDMVTESAYTALSLIASKHPGSSIVGLASGLPKNAVAVKSVFHNRIFIEPCRDGDTAWSVVKQEDAGNNITESGECVQYKDVIKILGKDLTISTIASSYRIAVSTVLDALAESNEIGTNTTGKVLASCTVTARKTSMTNNVVLDVKEIHSVYHELIILCMIQGLMHAQTYDTTGFNVYQ